MVYQERFDFDAVLTMILYAINCLSGEVSLIHSFFHLKSVIARLVLRKFSKKILAKRSELILNFS